MSIVTDYKLETNNKFFKFSVIDLACLYISSKLCKYFLKLKPNTITIISGIFGLLGLFIIVKNPDQRNYLIGSFLLILFLIFDCIDGEVARQTNQKSKIGAWLDPFFDKLVEGSVLLATGYLTYKSTLSVETFLMFVCTIIFFQLNQFLLIMDVIILKNSQSDNQSKILLIKPKLHVYLNLILKNLSLGHSALIVSFMIFINIGLIEHLNQIYFFWSLMTVSVPISAKFLALYKDYVN